MSFIDTITGIFSDNSTGGAIVRAVGSAIILNQVNKSVVKESQTKDEQRPDPGVREQVDPDTEHSVPVVYGTAFLGGIVTDAVQPNNITMWYCITICEKTGNLINGTPSVINIDRVYWNENEVLFQGDGVTVSSFRSEDGVVNNNPNGLIEIYFYNNGSANQTSPAGWFVTAQPAYSRMPGWTINHTMDDLVFALVKVTYNKEKQITGLGNLEFKIRNTMSQAGDVLYDYITNTRYGCGIRPEEINAS